MKQTVKYPIIDNFAVVILAAGQGTRLNCIDMPKVMMPLNGKPIVGYVIDTLNKMGFTGQQITLVVGYKRKAVREYFQDKVTYAIQEQQLGTAHAAYQGMLSLRGDSKEVLVLNGDDGVFYTAETFFDLMKKHQESQATASVLTTTIESGKKNYGRVIQKEDKIYIVEKENLKEEDLTETQTSTGTFCINREWFINNFRSMERIEGLGEYGLPVAPELAQEQGLKVQAVKMERPEEWFGINTKEEFDDAKQKLNL